MPNNICISSSAELMTPKGEKQDSDPGSFKNFSVAGVESIGVGSCGSGGQTRTLLHPCNAVEVPKWTFLGHGSLGAKLHHPSEKAGGMER